MVALDHLEFMVWSKYIRDLTGIQIEPSKTYLIESRLGVLLTEYGCRTYADLYRKAKADASRSIEKRIIDQITTHETSFFRDAAPFEMLKHKILPELIDRRTVRSGGKQPFVIRIWSAGCSTGQEVYSIAIAVRDVVSDAARCRIQITGTDISADALTRASRGVYSELEIQRGLTVKQVDHYFVRLGDKWKIKDEIRAMASFRKMSLLEPLGGMGTFDVIFCRNVAIYFNPEDRRQLFHRIAQVLEPDGYLIVGSTESLTGVCSRFQASRHLRSVFYQLVGPSGHG